jgi:DNA repair exonuclease SbcCD nuclease subunit
MGTTRLSFVGDIHLSDVPPKNRKDPDYLNTLLKKLDYVYDNSDEVVFLGDLFKTPVVSLGALNRVIRFLMLKDKKTYSIIGNHDVPYLNKKYLHKTSLGTLSMLGVSVVTDTFTVSGLNIDVISFKNKIEVEPSDNKVLLGHCFFESSLDESFSLTRNQLEGTKYSHVFLGHDHMPYDVLKINECSVYRPGSMCRDTGTKYNLDEDLQDSRVSFYTMLLSDSGEILGIERKYVPVLPIKEVFNSEMFMLKNNKVNMFSKNTFTLKHLTL